MKPSTILLVEDNADDVEPTRLALERNHIARDMIVAHSGDEALELLFSGTEPIDPVIILLDLALPSAVRQLVMDWVVVNQPSVAPGDAS